MSNSIFSLASRLKELESEIGDVVKRRVSEFLELNRSGSEEWFSELCFCILTANSSAELGIEIQRRVGRGFLEYPRDMLEEELRRAGHRFWRKRAEYIVEARKYAWIKEIVLEKIESGGVFGAREWLVENVKGLGYKEASHFLRNVGYFDVAILDRHVLSIMAENGMIEMPKTLTRKRYLEIEQKFFELSDSVGIRPGVLDLYVWYMKTGRVLK
ncbi:N-glycosylase/DNA lyase [Geoglobus sp.]